MNEFRIADFHVRVWDDDVFINGKNLSYWGSLKGTGIQSMYDNDSDSNREIEELCDQIRGMFIKLRNLTQKEQ